MTTLREKLARTARDHILISKGGGRFTAEKLVALSLDEMEIAIGDSIFAAIEESGMVIVPREATEEMVEAAIECGPIGCCNLTEKTAAEVYFAMLAAAPKEPTA